MISKTIIALGFGVGLLGGCGGGGNTALTTVPTAHLAISLPATTVQTDTAFTFTVTALDATNAVVPTYVGTVQITTSDTSAKLPANATLVRGVGRFTVTFKTIASQTITASDTVGNATPGTSAAISVTLGVTVSINPATATVSAGGMQAFTATVAGTSNHEVIWSVQESTAGGSITSAGVFTAPQAAGTFHVIATSKADSTKSATAAVTVTAPTQGGVPTISTLFPNCAPAGEQFVDVVDNYLTVISDNVSGTNFVTGSVVRWNGSDRPTSSNGSINALTAQISASDLATAGTATVTVFNPGPGGGTSNSLTFTITPGAVNPQSIAVDPAGKFAYVMSAGCAGGTGGYVSLYTINPTTGALAPIGPPVSTHGYGVDYGSGVNAGSVTVDPSGKFAYVTNSGDVYDYGLTDGADGSVAMYTIDATTGTLTYTTGGINGNCPGELCLPSSMVVEPSGKFAYVANGYGGGFIGSVPYNIAMYTINATTGALTSVGTIAAGPDPLSLAVDPSGNFVYVTTQSATPGSAGGVSIYAINATTGALTSNGTIAAGTDPVSIAVDAAGKFAYVANSGSKDVSMYTIDATTGALTSKGTVAAGTDPVSEAVDPTGKFAYAANSGSNDVSMYTINSTTGSLTSIGTIATQSRPTSMAIHPSGMFVYVTNSGSNSVSMYSINGATGTLTLIGTIGT